MANFEAAAVGPHTHIGCLSWFLVNCVKFVLLQKNFRKIIFFCLFGPYIAIGEKGGNIGWHPKPKSIFFGRSRKQIITFQTRTCMTRAYSQMQSTYKYSEHSSIIWPVWPNGWMFVSELSGSGFESSCNHMLSLNL